MIPDPNAPTQPTFPRSELPAEPAGPTKPHTVPRSRSRSSPAVRAGILIGLLLGVYFLAPFRTNVLILGIDRSPEGTALGRSDTMILTTVLPLRPYVGMLSIPRDLWVTLPGDGANRINAAHFFAEDAKPGSGPEAAMETVRTNFGVDVHHYLRIQFGGIRDFVDALGGLVVDLESPTALLPAGRHVLTGEEALAFVRDREGGDDFTRIGHAQLFVKAALAQLARPASWPRLPLALWAVIRAVNSDVPPWVWPRIALSVARLGPGGLDLRSITREMVNPFVTAGGANVLAPNWDEINPVLLEMFGQ